MQVPNSNDGDQPFTNFLDLPYGHRQFITVVNDPLRWLRSQLGSLEIPLGVDAGAATRVAATTAASAAAAVFGSGPMLLAAIAGGIIAAATASKGERAKSGSTELPDVFVVPISDVDALLLSLPPGHPRREIIYVGHPLIPKLYYPVAHFHRFLFEHKFAEAITLLMSLGATSLTVEHQEGWSRDFAAKLNVPFPQVSASASASAGKRSTWSRYALLEARLRGTARPRVPRGLCWYQTEPTWQAVAQGRLKHGLKDFTLKIHYQDDFGVNAGIEGKAARLKLELGGQFERHQSTVWRICGTFEE